MNRDRKGNAQIPPPSSSSSSGQGSSTTLADRAKRSQLGDPVSLKAETSNTTPTDDDKGAAGGRSATGPGSLADRAKKNPTALGDPVSLKAEKSDTVPTEDERGAIADKKKGSKL